MRLFTDNLWVVRQFTKSLKGIYMYLRASMALVRPKQKVDARAFGAR